MSLVPSSTPPGLAVGLGPKKLALRHCRRLAPDLGSPVAGRPADALALGGAYLCLVRDSGGEYTMARSLLSNSGPRPTTAELSSP